MAELRAEDKRMGFFVDSDTHFTMIIDDPVKNDDGMKHEIIHYQFGRFRPTRRRMRRTILQQPGASALRAGMKHKVRLYKVSISGGRKQLRSYRFEVTNVSDAGAGPNNLTPQISRLV
jgi:hypothetical protein